MSSGGWTPGQALPVLLVQSRNLARDLQGHCHPSLAVGAHGSGNEWNEVQGSGQGAMAPLGLQLSGVSFSLSPAVCSGKTYGAGDVGSSARGAEIS